MSTRAEAAKSAGTKKGLSPKQSRKNAQRKKPAVKAGAPPSALAKKKQVARGKRDTEMIIHAETAASSSDARARRTNAKRARVRASAKS
jgi:hypothetical protein